ncbi:MAG: hypothetical protein V1489_00610 [Candidatus Liptonbacteria bacterium]
MRNKTLILAVGVIALTAFAHSILRVEAGTNINSTTNEHWAWNDLMGWIDFYNTDTVSVSSAKLTGYASSSAGDISLDCATTRIGNICGRSNYGVTNSGGGNLSGWGWNDTYGWISFDCNNTGGCATSNYRVTIDGSGYFSNYAWNDVVGWISFNCADGSFCGPSNYKVGTSWRAVAATGTLDSVTFAPGDARGAQLHSIVWQGSQPAGTSVKFQIAVSNSSSGPWTYIGPDGTSDTYYTVDPDVSAPLDYIWFNNVRYFRYKITLSTDEAQTASPRVDSVSIHWSP